MIAVDVAEEASQWRPSLRMGAEEVNYNTVSGYHAELFVQRTSDLRKLGHDAVEGRHGRVAFSCKRESNEGA